MKLDELNALIANAGDVFDDEDTFEDNEDSMIDFDDDGGIDDVEDVVTVKAPVKKKQTAFSRPDEKQDGPITKEKPSDYIMAMYERSRPGNAELLTKNSHNACGCFHCKRIFAEKYVRVRGKTLYCPVCGEPSILTSTDTYQVSDGLIWRMWAYYYAFGKRGNPEKTA